jgi:acetoacetate decarboxylase
MADYGAPLTKSRKSAVYGPPPWHFAGRALSIFFKTDPEKLAKLLPPPLEGPTSGPRVGVGRFTVNEFVCDWGLGDELVWTNPARAICREGLVAIPAKRGEYEGELDAVLWCDNDAEIAACREVYGWAQKLGEVHLSWPYHSQMGPGAKIRAVVSRYQNRLATADITLERQIDPGDLPRWGSFLGFRWLPSAAPDGKSIQELIIEELGDKTLTDVWTGTGQLQLHGAEDEEIADLAPFEIAGAYYLKNEWRKMPAKVIPL